GRPGRPPPGGGATPPARGGGRGAAAPPPMGWGRGRPPGGGAPAGAPRSVGAGRSSTMQFHSPQSGQRPSHLELSNPQAWQAKTDRTRVGTGGVYRTTASQRVRSPARGVKRDSIPTIWPPST